jgi:hypothetical protein
MSPSVGESSSGESSERKSESRSGTLSILLGALAGTFALTVIAWHVRKRMSNRQHRELLKQ